MIMDCPVQFDGPVRIVAVVGRYLVLFDEGSEMLCGYPQNWRRPLSDVATDGDTLMQGSVLLPSGQIGIAYSRCPDDQCHTSSGVRFVRLRPESGDIDEGVYLPLRHSAFAVEWTRNSLYQPKFLFLAGSRGELLAYFTEAEEFLVVDSRTGALVQVWTSLPMEFGALVRSKNSETGGLTFTGIVQKVSHDPWSFNILDLTTKSVMYSFDIDESEVLVDVVENSDRSVIARRIVKDAAVVVACLKTIMNGEDNETRVLLGKARGSAPVASAELELLADGRQLLFRPEGAIGPQTSPNFRSEGIVVRVVQRIHDDPGYQIIHTLGAIRRVAGEPFSWARLSLDGEILFIVARPTGVLSVFDLARGKCLHSVGVCEQLRDIAVAGDFVVATGQYSNRIHLWHFNHFCAGGSLDSSCHAPFPLR